MVVRQKHSENAWRDVESPEEPSRDSPMSGEAGLVKGNSGLLGDTDGLEDINQVRNCLISYHLVGTRQLLSFCASPHIHILTEGWTQGLACARQVLSTLPCLLSPRLIRILTEGLSKLYRLAFKSLELAIRFSVGRPWIYDPPVSASQVVGLTDLGQTLPGSLIFTVTFGVDPP